MKTIWTTVLVVLTVQGVFFVEALLLLGVLFAAAAYGVAVHGAR